MLLRANLTHERHYTSDTTDFLNQLKRDHPDLEARQRAGRGRLWDRRIDADLQAEFKAARVPQTAYVYFEYGDPRGTERPHNWFIKAP